MVETYSATLRDGRIEWTSVPPELPPHVGVPVHVTLQKSLRSWEERAAAGVIALERIAARGGLGVDDPVAWQREIRADRSLPGRDE